MTSPLVPLLRQEREEKPLEAKFGECINRIEILR